MSDTVTAPWTREQVLSLNCYQLSGVAHPFTCGRRGEDPRVDGDDAAIHGDLLGDTGVLVATSAGWVCPDCDYTQGWAHSWMADNSWRTMRTPAWDQVYDRRYSVGPWAEIEYGHAFTDPDPSYEDAWQVVRCPGRFDDAGTHLDVPCEAQRTNGHPIHHVRRVVLHDAWRPA